MPGVAFLVMFAFGGSVVSSSVRRMTQDCSERGLIDDLTFGVEDTGYWSYDAEQRGVMFHNSRKDVALYSNIYNSDSKITGVTFDVKIPAGGYLQHRLLKDNQLTNTIRVSSSNMAFVRNDKSHSWDFPTPDEWITISHQFIAVYNEADQLDVSKWTEVVFVNGQKQVLSTNVTWTGMQRLTSSEVVGFGEGVMFRNRRFTCTETYPVVINSVEAVDTVLSIQTTWDMPRTFSGSPSFYLSSSEQCTCGFFNCDYPSSDFTDIDDDYTVGFHTFVTYKSGSWYYICLEGFAVGEPMYRINVSDLQLTVTISSKEVAVICSGKDVACSSQITGTDFNGDCTVVSSMWFGQDFRCCGVVFCTCPTSHPDLDVHSGQSGVYVSVRESRSCFKYDLPILSEVKISTSSEGGCDWLSSDVANINCYSQCFADPNEYSDCTGLVDHGYTCHKWLSLTEEGCSEEVVCQDGFFSSLVCHREKLPQDSWDSNGSKLTLIGGTTYHIRPLPNSSCSLSVRTSAGTVRLATSIENKETKATYTNGAWQWSVEVTCVQGCSAPSVVGAHPLQTIAANGESVHWAAREGYYCEGLESQCVDHDLIDLPKCTKSCLIPTELHIILRCDNTVPLLGDTCVWEPDTLSDCSIQSARVTCRENGFDDHPEFNCIHRNLIAPVGHEVETAYSEGSFKFGIVINALTGSMFYGNELSDIGRSTAAWLRERVAEVLSGEYISCKVVVLEVCHADVTCVDVSNGVSYSNHERRAEVLETDANLVFAVYPATASNARAEDISHTLGLVLKSGTVIELPSGDTIEVTNPLTLTQDSTSYRTPYPQYSGAGVLSIPAGVLAVVIATALLLS